MGKGKRNRDRKNAAAAASPRGAVPEMLPNTPDSSNDMPTPGYLSEHSRDYLDPQVTAWSMLNMYLGVIMDLEDRARPFGARRDDVDHEAVACRVAEDLRVLNPAEFSGTERNVAEFTGAMKPRWRGQVTGTILGEVSAWIAETGYQPDLRAWFTGAQQFVPVTVPAQHRNATRELLDYDRLRAETDRVNAEQVNAGRDTPVPEFDLDRPETSMWYALAMRAYPLAMVHAAAALAAWVHGQPGAVAEPNQKRLELGERAMKFLDIVSRAPRRDPSEPEEPEPPYVAPWEVRAEPAPDLPTGEMVDVAYDGPPMTPWTVAYLWASMLTTLRDFKRRGRFAEVPDPGDSPMRALLARAISIHARLTGLTGDRPVPGPAVLSPMSLPLLSLNQFNPPVALIQFMDADLGHHPTPGEPGYQAYLEVHETIRAGGLTAQEVLADEKLGAELDRSADALIREIKKANGAILHAMQLAIPDVDGAPIPNDALFGQLGGYLNDYLRAAPLPADDTEFRLLMEQEVGWPGGKPPAGLVTSAGPWHRVAFTPTTREGGEKGRAWCQWLLAQGWAVGSHEDADDNRVWLALPDPYATDLWMATQHFTFGSSAIVPWANVATAAGDTPDEAFLRQRYGTP